VNITRSAEPVVVRVSGKVDFAATDEFAAAITDAAVVDLSDVTWLSGAACAELAWAHRTGGGRLRVRPPSVTVVEHPQVLVRLTAVEPLRPLPPQRLSRERPVAVG
jgi:anti-anti-sigma regulatory factor